MTGHASLVQVALLDLAKEVGLLGADGLIAEGGVVHDNVAVGNGVLSTPVGNEAGDAGAAAAHNVGDLVNGAVDDIVGGEGDVAGLLWQGIGQGEGQEQRTREERLEGRHLV